MFLQYTYVLTGLSLPYLIIGQFVLILRLRYFIYFAFISLIPLKVKKTDKEKERQVRKQIISSKSYIVPNGADGSNLPVLYHNPTLLHMHTLTHHHSHEDIALIEYCSQRLYLVGRRASCNKRWPQRDNKP